MISKLSLLILFLFISCSRDPYDQLMKTALFKKTKDPNPHPVFAGDVEPDYPKEEENNKTLLGIDKNNNGIRDDVDIWINRTGKNYNEIMALRQKARGLQSYFKAINDNRPDLAESTFNKIVRGGYCIEVIFANNDNNELVERMNFNLDHIGIYPRDLRMKAMSKFFEYITSLGGNYDVEGGDESHYKFCTFEVQNKELVIKNYLKKFEK
jgi:hypothetical protein